MPGLLEASSPVVHALDTAKGAVQAYLEPADRNEVRADELADVADARGVLEDEKNQPAGWRRHLRYALPAAAVGGPLLGSKAGLTLLAAGPRATVSPTMGALGGMGLGAAMAGGAGLAYSLVDQASRAGRLRRAKRIIAESNPLIHQRFEDPQVRQLATNCAEGRRYPWQMAELGATLGTLGGFGAGLYAGRNAPAGGETAKAFGWDTGLPRSQMDTASKASLFAGGAGLVGGALLGMYLRKRRRQALIDQLAKTAADVITPSLAFSSPLPALATYQNWSPNDVQKSHPLLPGGKLFDRPMTASRQLVAQGKITPGDTQAISSLVPVKPVQDLHSAAYNHITGHLQLPSDSPRAVALHELAHATDPAGVSLSPWTAEREIPAMVTESVESMRQGAQPGQGGWESSGTAPWVYEYMKKYGPKLTGEPSDATAVQNFMQRIRGGDPHLTGAYKTWVEQHAQWPTKTIPLLLAAVGAAGAAGVLYYLLRNRRKATASMTKTAADAKIPMVPQMTPSVVPSQRLNGLLAPHAQYLARYRLPPAKTIPEYNGPDRFLIPRR